MTSAEVSGSELSALLPRLHGAVDGSHIGAVQALMDRFENGRLRVLVAGEAKRGKSSLINAVLGRDVLPRGALPVTSLATELVAGDRANASGGGEHAQVDFADGRTERVPLGELRGYVTEAANPHNRLGVARVTVRLDHGVPHQAMTLIDTPGVGSLLGHNTTAAGNAYQSMDAVVLVLTGDAPLSATERDLLNTLTALAVRSYVVVNKSDLIDTPEVEQVLRYVADQATDSQGRRLPVFLCSATKALAARIDGDEAAWRASGVAGLSDALVREATSHGAADLRLSIAVTAGRVAARARDEAHATEAALSVAGHQRADLVAALETALCETWRRRRDARQLLRAQALDEVSAFSDDARRAVGVLTDEVFGAIARLSDQSASPTESATSLEARGRSVIADLVSTAASTWYQDWFDHLTETLHRQVGQQRGLLAHDADALTDSAYAILGINLVAPQVDVEEVSPAPLILDFTPGPSWNSELASAVRRRGTRQAVHRRTVAQLQREATTLVDRSLGRARSSLQSQAEETTRRLDQTLGLAFNDQAQALRGAHSAAEAAAGLSDAQHASRRHRAADRMRELDDLLQLLAHIGSDVNIDAGQRVTPHQP